MVPLPFASSIMFDMSPLVNSVGALHGQCKFISINLLRSTIDNK